MGDRVRVADLIQHDPEGARNNSFIRYELLPDANANRANQPDRAVCAVYYGRILDIFYVEYIINLETDERRPYLLARVEECNTLGLDAARPENPIVTYNQLNSADIIHLGAVHAAVGRIRVGGRNTWAIIDCSRGARTQFNNDEGDPDPDLE
ncbi:hypothetical protein BDV93DRAFT_558507 [Ceratobasidium sp. AG-I]|nr:hypothetical protein BDV93DRAFT_558507 [Ceratobasidium sp. AG-I]